MYAICVMYALRACMQYAYVMGSGVMDCGACMHVCTFARICACMCVSCLFTECEFACMHVCMCASRLVLYWFSPCTSAFIYAVVQLRIYAHNECSSCMYVMYAIACMYVSRSCMYLCISCMHICNDCMRCNVM